MFILIEEIIEIYAYFVQFDTLFYIEIIKKLEKQWKMDIDSKGNHVNKRKRNFRATYVCDSVRVCVKYIYH